MQIIIIMHQMDPVQNGHTQNGHKTFGYQNGHNQNGHTVLVKTAT